MLYLILETSSSRGLISVLRDEEVLLSKEVPFGVRESGELVPILETMLAQTQIELKDFQNIILGIGPGSFTGLRIGASVAKALSFAKEIPIIGVSSLKTFQPDISGPFGVILDAKVHGVYLQRGLSENGEIQYEEESKVYSVDSFEAAARDLPLLITSHRLSLEKKFEDEALLDRLVEYSPNPIQMYRQAMKQPLKNHLFAQDQMNLKYFDVKG